MAVSRSWLARGARWSGEKRTPDNMSCAMQKTGYFLIERPVFSLRLDKMARVREI
jgi:hypothetical protein